MSGAIAKLNSTAIHVYLNSFLVVKGYLTRDANVSIFSVKDVPHLSLVDLGKNLPNLVSLETTHLSVNWF
ncbi:hypothetical protein MC7420_2591 [Coleofasciculus chthonoplastes PCC 7420]|uniref:Uncharacterized protein n=1 Tax=Coleofasciculus chthonoplastes PCC 7420 TaxID=118168 RepID=B4VYI7_9CYAN|nr:hypothetical protein MC7420_2591 [Coleofasciculus chthonoplastes PCC 7420]